MLADDSFEFGTVRTAVLSFVLLQDGYNIVLSSAVLRTAIATVGSRRSGNWPPLSRTIHLDLELSGQLSGQTFSILLTITIYPISAGAFLENDALSSSPTSGKPLEPLRTSSVLGHYCRPNPLHLDSELQHFPETSIPWMNPAAGMQNLAVLFRVHTFRSFDPFSING